MIISESIGDVYTEIVYLQTELFEEQFRGNGENEDAIKSLQLKLSEKIAEYEIIKAMKGL